MVTILDLIYGCTGKKTEEYFVQSMELELFLPDFFWNFFLLTHLVQLRLGVVPELGTSSSVTQHKNQKINFSAKRTNRKDKKVYGKNFRV